MTASNNDDKPGLAPIVLISLHILPVLIVRKHDQHRIVQSGPCADDAEELG
jgi:hypothetical protein